MATDLIIQTLHAAIDHIIKSDSDQCQLCVHCEKYNAAFAEADEAICPAVKSQGEAACRNGIIEKFQMDLAR